MKKYVTIKMETTDRDELEKWIKNTLELTEVLRPRKERIDWLKKLLKIINNEEPTSN